MTDLGFTNLVYLIDVYTTPEVRLVYLNLTNDPSIPADVVVEELLSYPARRTQIYQQITLAGVPSSLILDANLIGSLSENQRERLVRALNLEGSDVDLVGFMVGIHNLSRDLALFEGMLPPIPRIFDQVDSHVTQVIIDQLGVTGEVDPLLIPEFLAVYLQLRYASHYSSARANLNQIVDASVHPMTLTTWVQRLGYNSFDRPGSTITDVIINRSRGSAPPGVIDDMVHVLYQDRNSLVLTLDQGLLNRLSRYDLARAMNVESASLVYRDVGLDQLGEEALRLIGLVLPASPPPDLIQPNPLIRISYVRGLIGSTRAQGMNMNMIDAFLTVYLSNRSMQISQIERTAPVQGSTPELANLNLLIARHVPRIIIRAYTGSINVSPAERLIQDQTTSPERSALLGHLFAPNLSIQITPEMIQRWDDQALAILWPLMSRGPPPPTIRQDLTRQRLVLSELSPQQMELIRRAIIWPLPRIEDFTHYNERTVLARRLRSTLATARDTERRVWLSGYLAASLEELAQTGNPQDLPMTARTTRMTPPAYNPRRPTLPVHNPGQTTPPAHIPTAPPPVVRQPTQMVVNGQPLLVGPHGVIRQRRVARRLSFEDEETITSYLESLLPRQLVSTIPVNDPDNPYEYIGITDLQSMATDRGIVLPPDRESLVVGLHNYDRIDPTYLNQAQVITPNSSRNDILLFAGLHRIYVLNQTFGNDELLRLAVYVATTLPGWSGFRQVEARPIQDQDIGTIRTCLPNVRKSEQGIYQLFAQYPPPIGCRGVEILTAASPENRRSIFRITGDVMLSDLLDDITILFGLVHGWALSEMAPSPEMIQRYQHLESQPTIVRSTLDWIYGNEEGYPLLGAAVTAIRNGRVSPLEPYAFYLGQPDGAQTIVQHLQIIPPQGVNIEQYLRDNLFHYRQVVTRGDAIPVMTLDQLASSDQAFTYLDRLTDREVFDLTGVFLAYLNRMNLITTMTRALTTPRFFLPIRRNCVNQITVSGDDTTDPEILVVAYGTLTRYGCYTLEELLDSFAPTDPALPNTFVFGNPTRERSFTLPEARQLLETLTGLPQWQPLVERITQGLELARPLTSDDEGVLADYQNVIRSNPGAEEMIRNYLHLLFDTGMYMRRWHGPGCPYPLRESETKSTINPDIKTSEGLGNMSVAYDAMPKPVQEFIQRLMIIRFPYIGQRIPSYGIHSLYHSIQRVVEGDYCIRMASSVFVISGWYYLRLFFNEDITDFVPDFLDEIQ